VFLAQPRRPAFIQRLFAKVLSEGDNSMSETVLVGRGRQITPIPRQEWERHLSDVPQHQEARLAFMSADHHRARYFVVKELARTGAPIPPEFIAQELMLPLAQVQTILEDLEKHLLFLVRNEQGAVSWAFPITIDTTPHHLTFNTGEQVYAA
jgi:hypothetical protein